MNAISLLISLSDKQINRNTSTSQDIAPDENLGSLSVERALDEVVVAIAGKKQGDDAPSTRTAISSMRSAGDSKAARRLLTRLLKQQGRPPRRMITDKFGSCTAARCPIMPAIEHRSPKGLNNRAENSHVPLRNRECSHTNSGRRGHLPSTSMRMRLRTTCQGVGENVPKQRRALE